MRIGKIECKCSVCGTPLMRYPSVLKKTAHSFCSGECERAFFRSRVGADNPLWKGGVKMSNGYRCVYAPEHPRAHKGRVYEHVVIAERSIGRLLEAGEQVHHINHDPLDNRPENLLVVSGVREHATLHDNWGHRPCRS